MLIDWGFQLWYIFKHLQKEEKSLHHACFTKFYFAPQCDTVIRDSVVIFSCWIWEIKLGIHSLLYCDSHCIVSFTWFQITSFFPYFQLFVITKICHTRLSLFSTGVLLWWYLERESFTNITFSGSHALAYGWNSVKIKGQTMRLSMPRYWPRIVGRGGFRSLKPPKNLKRLMSFDPKKRKHG